MDGIERLLEDFNRIKAACQEMEQKKIRVGIVGGKADSDIMAIAHAHEYGATIKPKKGKYLAIPLTKEAQAAGSPRAFSDLRFVNAKDGISACYDSFCPLLCVHSWLFYDKLLTGFHRDISVPPGISCNPLTTVH